MEKRIVFTRKELAEAVGVSVHVTVVELVLPMVKIFTDAHDHGRVTLEDLNRASEVFKDPASRCSQKISERLAQVLQPTDPPPTIPDPDLIDEMVVSAGKQINEIVRGLRDAIDLEYKLPPAPDRKRKLP